MTEDKDVGFTRIHQLLHILRLVAENLALRYQVEIDLWWQFMNNFNRAMIALEEEFQFVSSSKQYISCADESQKVRKSLFAHLALFKGDIKLCHQAFPRECGLATLLHRIIVTTMCSWKCFNWSLLQFNLYFIHDVWWVYSQLIVFEKGDLVVVFNFHPTNTYSGLVFFSLSF